MTAIYFRTKDKPIKSPVGTNIYTYRSGTVVSTHYYETTGQWLGLIDCNGSFHEVDMLTKSET